MEVDKEHVHNDAEFRRNLTDMQASGTFCDAFMCIPGEEKKLPVHRAVMASCSDFFRSLFTNGLQETQQREVTIHGVTLSVMEVIIHFAYTKRATLTTENIEDIFAAADRFSMLVLLEECINFLLLQLLPENCLGVLRFARFYNCKSLADKCWLYIMLKFNHIVQTSPEFQKLEVHELAEIVRDKKLDVVSEDSVLDAVIKWIDFCPRQRKRHYDYLIQSIRLPYLPEESFAKKLLCKRELKKGTSFDSIKNAHNLVKLYRSRKNYTVKMAIKEITHHELPRIPNHIIFVIGGWAKEGVTGSVETYDRNTDQWFEMPDCALPTPRAYHGTVALLDRIYVLGGFNGSHYLNSVVCFDVSAKIWEERAPMYMSRCYVSTAEIGGTIYACGGFDGRQRHSSVERYKRKGNQWTLVKPMFHQRSDAGAISHDGKLFVSGGFDGQACLFSTEMYDPEADQWTILAPMTSRRSGVNLGVCNNRIYAVGGYDGMNRLDTVEYYDCLRKHWYSAADMILGRSNFSCVVMDGVIYVMGGYDGTKTSTHVECYSPDKKLWSCLCDMNIGRSAVSACAVRDINNACDFTFHGNQWNCGDNNHGNDGDVSHNGDCSRWMALWRNNERSSTPTSPTSR